MKKHRSPLRGVCRRICRSYMGTKTEKRRRAKVREKLCCLQPMEPAGRLLETYYAENLKTALFIMAVGFLLAAVAILQGGGRKTDNVTEISRNTHGSGVSEKDLQVTIGGQPAGTLHITVQEQAYTEEETLQKLKNAAEKLDAEILGENPSLNDVSEDLWLPVELEDGFITVCWESDDPQVLEASGSVHTDKVSKEGVKVNLKAVLSAQEQEYSRSWEVLVKPRAFTENEERLEELRIQIEDMERFRPAAPVLPLPQKIQGQQVTYREDGEDGIRWPVFLLLPVLAVILSVSGKEAELERKVRSRDRQLMLDYPGIIHKLTLLLGAGLTVSDAWGRVTMEYVRRREEGGKRRYAYEEMLLSYREMQGGMPQTDVYDRFGRRCRLTGYVKLGALLKQNLTKGSSGLIQLLTYEGVQASEEQKSVVKRMGEEAATKLLLPMFLMLAVVIVILIVPAVMAMGIS